MSPFSLGIPKKDLLEMCQRYMAFYLTNLLGVSVMKQVHVKVNRSYIKPSLTYNIERIRTLGIENKEDVPVRVFVVQKTYTENFTASEEEIDVLCCRKYVDGLQIDSIQWAGCTC